MTDLPPAYPLQWPASKPRRHPNDRKIGRFSTKNRTITIAGAFSRLQAELDRIGANLPVISSNLELKADGLPRSTPNGPGPAGAVAMTVFVAVSITDTLCYKNL